MSLSNCLLKKLVNYSDPNSFGSKLRAKRLKNFIPLIDQIYSIKGSVNIIDIGGTKQYWNILDKAVLRDKKINITLVNIPGTDLKVDEENFSYIYANGCDLSQIADRTFDIAHSNSVIEHVGDWSNMKQFALELKRVANSYYVQTPSYGFPIEPHCLTPFFHWLPLPFKIYLVSHLKLGNWSKAKDIDSAIKTIESARLITHKMFHALFPEAEHKYEKFLFLTKSYIAIKKQTIES